MGGAEEEDQSLINNTSFSSSSSSSQKEDSTTVSSVGEDKVDFAPASAEQFGELGSGSKFMEYLPDFSAMSVESNNLVGMAGAGAVALMALGAIFAVPVAPIILRRTGNNGWAGLPSWSDLFSWWSSPDPVAEAWVDKNQHGYGYDEDYPTAPYYNNEQYYAYDTTGSGSSNQNTYYAEADENLLQYTSQKGDVDYTGQSDGQTYAAPANYYAQEQGGAYENDNGLTRQRNERPKTSVDGHEYVTLEQLNRIGEESVKMLGEMAKGYTPEDLYAFRGDSNQLRRRRLQTRFPVNQVRSQQQQQQQQHNRRPQYQPQPSYQESQQEFQKTHTEEKQPTQPQSGGPEGFPNKKVFSLTQPDSVEDAQYETDSPYKHSYSFSDPGIDSSSFHQQDEGVDDVQGEKSMLKVSEFPYQFHKEQ